MSGDSDSNDSDPEDPTRIQIRATRMQTTRIRMTRIETTRIQATRTCIIFDQAWHPRRAHLDSYLEAQSGRVGARSDTASLRRRWPPSRRWRRRRQACCIALWVGQAGQPLRAGPPPSRRHGGPATCRSSAGGAAARRWEKATGFASAGCSSVFHFITKGNKTGSLQLCIRE